MKRYKKNYDERTRRAERQSYGGDSQSTERLIVSRLRQGQLTQARVMAAAFLRDPAAAAVVKGFGLRPKQSLIDSFTYGSSVLEDRAYFKFLDDTGIDERADSAWARLIFALVFFVWHMGQPRP